MPEAKILGFVCERIGFPYTSHLPYRTKNRAKHKEQFSNSDQHDMMAERIKTKEVSP